MLGTDRLRGGAVDKQLSDYINVAGNKFLRLSNSQAWFAAACFRCNAVNNTLVDQRYTYRPLTFVLNRNTQKATETRCFTSENVHSPYDCRYKEENKQK